MKNLSFPDAVKHFSFCTWEIDRKPAKPDRKQGFFFSSFDTCLIEGALRVAFTPADAEVAALAIAGVLPDTVLAALAVYNGELIVGGEGLRLGSYPRNLAKWDGTAWAAQQ
ncbi:MAG TPA: hypothetical protein PL048_21980, partial [Leptospiraceae bacterium]|nr:hypothetical protein [Leptospiraceae bacterium]